MCIMPAVLLDYCLWVPQESLTNPPVVTPLCYVNINIYAALPPFNPTFEGQLTFITCHCPPNCPILHPHLFNVFLYMPTCHPPNQSFTSPTPLVSFQCRQTKLPWLQLSKPPPPKSLYFLLVTFPLRWWVNSNTVAWTSSFTRRSFLTIKCCS